MVGRMLGPAEVEEGVALCLLVPVEHDRLGAAVPGPAADEGMLAPLTVTGEIGEGAVRLGNGGIVLLDAAPHLGHKPGLEILGTGESGRGIGVLLLKAGADGRIERSRILEDLFPVLGLQPGIIVPNRNPMHLEDMRLGRNDRRSGQGAGGEALKFHGVIRIASDDGVIMHR